MSASPAIRRVLAVVLAAGTLAGAAAVPAAADDHRRDHHGRHSALVIGDVSHDNPVRGDRSNRALNREWVEIRNTGRSGVNLRGYTLTDQQGNRYRFPDFRLEGRSAVKVHTGRGRDSRHDLYQGRTRQIWDDRDTATLRDHRGGVVDTESWGRRGHQHRG
ncbi:lamin tail domain-containing protein [Streptomyces sp. PCS3-D2]|uniref:lamin tail domain-containing protein n=1 Tax=Streptomyces sp. PCS3-D2 TaxID=1460244 RepID=UPI00044BD95E|nr:lamin tail domain-containing protein [Streptomyces sp. PCS3-D2]WKV70055.1 lamin tail domain-containing protein [Streptomyces sp. PCS3-D2]WKV76002.1 lamin tail domain-containing protein [Streptomyces sp. PCS3-D2]